MNENTRKFFITLKCTLVYLLFFYVIKLLRLVFNFVKKGRFAMKVNLLDTASINSKVSKKVGILKQ